MDDASLSEDFVKKHLTDADICEVWESQLLSQRRSLELIRTNMILREEIMEVRCQLQETRSKAAETLAEGRDRSYCAGRVWDVGSIDRAAEHHNGWLSTDI